jgi:outer membrane protein W
MRTLRRMAFGIAFVALLPTISAAQSGRLFKNSWFWGAKGGLMSFSTATAKNEVQPLVGIEWLITRNKGALYISGDQTFFTSTSALVGDNGQQFRLGIHDLRRYSAALLAFPVEYGRFRPYGGVGFSLNLIQSVSVRDSVDATTAAALRNAVADVKDAASFIAMAGVQAELRPFSLFGQVTYMPAKTHFLLNGRTTYLLEGGVRFNIGPSHDGP